VLTHEASFQGSQNLFIKLEEGIPQYVVEHSQISHDVIVLISTRSSLFREVVRQLAKQRLYVRPRRFAKYRMLCELAVKPSAGLVREESWFEVSG
jgi:hypothetical protein